MSTERLPKLHQHTGALLWLFMPTHTRFSGSSPATSVLQG